MPTAPKIYVTGVGVWSQAGHGVSPLWLAAQAQRTLTQSGFGTIPELPTNPQKPWLALAESSAREAMGQAGWSGLGSQDGLVIGTTTGFTLSWENEMIDFIQKKIPADQFAQAFAHTPLGVALSALNERLSFNGRSTLVTTACAASLHALALAVWWLRQGTVKRCLVGGVETQSRLTRDGFRSLQLISEDPCKPFDTDRKGINLSEGSAFLCLEVEPSSVPLAVISGVGASLDAYHMTSPHPSGLGSERAMRAAMREANLESHEIDWVHAHGTGSPHNDAAEAAAISQIFAGTTAPPVTSSKGTHGHFLGATGLIETALVIESIRKQIVLPTTGHTSTDPQCKIPIVIEPRSVKIRHVIKNVLGFGGTNAAVVVSAA